jgi:chromosomal replication initiator protein
MKTNRRPKTIAFPRQIAMYLARELTNHSLQEIGDAFGGRDHSTVIHAHKLVKRKMDADPNLKMVVSRLKDETARS